MARDILSEYGPDHNSPHLPTPDSGQTHDGGRPYCKPLNYSTPTGPIHQKGESPGLPGGTNYGNSGTQGSR